MRVMITGMGGDLGTRVATLVEADDAVEAVEGLDVEPPRRHLRRAAFHLVDPRDRARAAAVVRAFAPTVLVHLGVYEPNARSSPRTATERTALGSAAALDAARRSGSLERIVVRSGTEVYGRGSEAPERPDESCVPHPTSPFGRSLLHVERLAVTEGGRAGAPVAVLRLAPVLGPHVPSPLGRLLRLPFVPVPALGGGAFSVVHRDDAARAVVAAVLGPAHDGPVNVVAPGEVSAWEAARLGGRVPVPVWGLGWQMAKLTGELSSTPLPDHVVELLIRGRLADGSLLPEVFDTPPHHSTPEVVRDVHGWAELSWVRRMESGATGGAASAA
jgi:UDP-glucose 4-epimerase